MHNELILLLYKFIVTVRQAGYASWTKISQSSKLPFYYSYFNATIGASREALSAGQKPKMMPTMAVMDVTDRTANVEITKDHSVMVAAILKVRYAVTVPAILNCNTHVVKTGSELIENRDSYAPVT